MTFSLTSFSFMIFILISVCVYYIMPWRGRWISLLAANIVFFLFASGWKTIPYLLYGIVITYAGARIISMCEGDKKKKTILLITLFLTLSELICLKYQDFFQSFINFFAGGSNGQKTEPMIYLLVPIGISYYTLSAVGYILDVYWGSCEAENNIFKHALYFCYFPAMTSGPFMKYEAMKEQFFRRNDYNHETFVAGVQRIIWGFFKKLVIADRLAALVATVYGDYNTYSGVYIFVAILGYALQLYADFSGCMDIISGVSELFCIKLPENFQMPFFSKSISEFWRRWHISLGEWFKAFLLYPLLKSSFFQNIGNFCKRKFGKKAGKNISTYLGLLINWFIIGIWHGGTAKYMIASGFLPSMYLIGGNVLTPFYKKVTQKLKVKKECFSYKLFQCIRTFLLLCVIFGIARAEGLRDAFHLFRNMFTTYNPWILVDGSLLNLGLDAKEMCVAVIAVAILIIVEILHEKGLKLRKLLSEQNIIFQWMIMITAILLIIIFGIYGPNYDAVNFIYGQF